MNKLNYTIAMWHYPYRSVIENVEFFISKGLTGLSIAQRHIIEVIDNGQEEKLAKLLQDNHILLTVHGQMSVSHAEEDVATFHSNIRKVAAWQDKYHCIHIISFDVLDPIRDRVKPYIDFVLDQIPDCKVAVEDFGLNASEREQVEYLKSNPRFGYLLDIGHMYLRLCGRDLYPQHSILMHKPDECKTVGEPNIEQFREAFDSKEFPIFEIHLHNNDGCKDMHHFLRCGTLDMNIMFTLLKEREFQGVITIESAPGYEFECTYPESDIRILEDVEYLKQNME